MAFSNSTGGLIDLDPALYLPERMMAEAEAAGEDRQPAFSMVMDVAGQKISYVVQNGDYCDVKESDLENAQVRVTVTQADVEKMLAAEHLELLLELLKSLPPARYGALKFIRGKMVAELEGGDGTWFTIESVFNGAESPRVFIRMKAVDSAAVLRRKADPVRLFVSGALKVKGDLGFALAVKPLFT